MRIKNDFSMGLSDIEILMPFPSLMRVIVPEFIETARKMIYQFERIQEGGYFYICSNHLTKRGYVDFIIKPVFIGDGEAFVSPKEEVLTAVARELISKRHEFEFNASGAALRLDYEAHQKVVLGFSGLSFKSVFSETSMLDGIAILLLASRGTKYLGIAWAREMAYKYFGNSLLLKEIFSN